MKYTKKKEKNVLITAALPPFPTGLVILKAYLYSIALAEVPTAFKDYNESTSAHSDVLMEVKLWHLPHDLAYKFDFNFKPPSS